MRLFISLAGRLVAVALLSAGLAASQYTLTAPDSVKAGASFNVTVSGELPANTIVTIVKKSHAPGRGPLYSYFHKPPNSSLRAPDEPGADYELRLLENHRTLLASRPITVNAVTATLDAPATVEAGGTIAVKWSGEASSDDQIRLTKVGAPANDRLAYAYLSKNPAALTAPDEAGEYEIRYVTGQAKLILASRRISVGGTSAAVTPPAEVPAGALLSIAWEGPNNAGDVINVVPVGSDKRLAWGYPGNGNPATMTAPREPGEYEARYQTGQSRAILARAPLRVVPAAQQAGNLVVRSSAANAGPSGAAVEIILDASGSMLQRMGSERRIDVAKRTLLELTAEMIPAGTPFALRVFGKEVGSCQTDLEIPLAPLDPAAVAGKIGSVQAQNNAKTPIAASMAKVAADLRGATGERAVVLITDGEETCDGDPAAAIEALQGAGIDVRVNVVGFAIDDQSLKDTFQDWAEIGDGGYFEANDAAALKAALSGALQPRFEVMDSSGRAVANGVAGGPAVELMPGAYTVKTDSGSQSANIDPGKTATVELQ